MVVVATMTVANLLNDSPGKYRMADCGRILGISRERVRQIVNRRGLRDLVKWSNDNCCADCNIKLGNNNKSGLCRKCLKGLHWQNYECDWCGQLNLRKISHARRYKHHFCNRVCFGKWAGTNYGNARLKEYPVKMTAKRATRLKEFWHIKSDEELENEIQEFFDKRIDYIIPAVYELKGTKE